MKAAATLSHLTPLPAGVVPLLTTAEAARYLGLSVRHIQDRADIPRIDVSAPGATRPAWRYRVEDLARFAVDRTIAPYKPVSPPAER